MNELIFHIKDAPEGGFTACALGHSIFTEANTLEELRRNVRDAVQCHFDDGKAPKVIRLHFVREEVLAGFPSRNDVVKTSEFDGIYTS